MSLRNSLDNYYRNMAVNGMAGTGIPGYHGSRIQKGGGWFGNAFKGILLPLLQYIAPKLINTGAQVANDAIAGENIMQSLKTRGKATAQEVAQDAAARAQQYMQTGKGRRRRRRVLKRSVKKPRRSVKRLAGRKRSRKLLNRIPVFG